MKKIDIESWGPKLAKSVLRNAVALKKGENLTIEVWTPALQWIDSFLIEARKMGVAPMVIYESEGAFWTNVKEGRAKSLGEVGSQEIAALKESDAYVYFWGPADRLQWHSLPDSTVRSLTAYDEDWFKIAEETGLRWCRVELARATEALAADYGIDYYDWVTELLEASTIDPRPMVRDGRKIAEKFESGHEVEISHRNGTNLRLRLKGRKCFVDDGIVDEADVKDGFAESNVPAGVVTVAVDESYAEGRFVSNRPTRHGPSKGRSDNGVWTFENGRLVQYDYEKGKRSFDKLYANAGDERDRPGILSIGLNPKIRNSPLFEDQEYGVVTLYVGSNGWLDGENGGDFKSWIALRGSDVKVDGTVVLKSGKIVR